MDHGSFDRIARLLASAGSRRAALGALLGAGALGVSEATAARSKKKRRTGKKGKDGVSAQAVCAPPSNGVNRSNCDYSGQDFSGQAIHSSIYKNTIFRNADLIETDLSSSNMRGANFRGANLCGADLSSSTLRDADFRGFAFPGRETNLALADLHSSACGGLLTNGRTFICGTTWCDGTIRNDDCPGGLPSDLCCTRCGVGEECINNECVAVCDGDSTSTSCDCATSFVGENPVCVNTVGMCGNQSCTSDGDCTGDDICASLPCCAGRCAQPCALPDDCTCASGSPGCNLSELVKCGETVAARRAGAGGVEKVGTP